LLGQSSSRGDNTIRGDSSSLIVRREAVVKQLLNFADKWSQAAAPTKRGARGAVDVLATRLTSLHLKLQEDPAALKALEVARAVVARMIAELADVTLRLIEALVVEPAAAAARQEQERKSEAARHSLMRRRRHVPARTGHERESQREVVDDDDDDDDDDGDGDDDESDLDWEEDFLPPPAFDKSCLEWAVSQATGSRNVPSRVAAGLDYLLRALLDVHRLPLPSASDPLLLRWFEFEAESDEADAPLGMLTHPAPLRRKRMAVAEAALVGLLSTRQHEAIRLAERASIGRSDKGWRALCVILYGATGGFTLRMRQNWERRQAAIRVQTIFRRRMLKYKCQRKLERKLEQNAIRIQRAFRRDSGPSLVGISQGASGESKAQRLREAREEQKRSRQEEKRQVDEMRAARKRAARQRVLFKRRRALYSALPDARRFFTSLNIVQRAIRAKRARRMLLQTRIKRGGASLVATPTTSRAAAVWQSRFRSWSLRADLVATEHTLCVAAYPQPARAARAAPLEALLVQLRREADATREAAEARRDGAAHQAADAYHAHATSAPGAAPGAAANATSSVVGVTITLGTYASAERDVRQCEARRRLLEAVRTLATIDAVDAQLIARAQAQVAREITDEALSTAVAEPELAAGSGRRPPAAAAQQQQRPSEKKLGRSEVVAALSRHRELAAWACSLQGAAACVDQLQAKHEWAPPLLLAQAAHLHAASATWVAQRDAAEELASRQCRQWLCDEALATLERAAAALRAEASLYLQADGGESDDEQESGVAAGGTTAGGATGCGDGGGGAPGAVAGAGAMAAVLPDVRVGKLLEEAQKAEVVARQRAKVAGEARDEWAAASEQRASAVGELQLVAALEATARRQRGAAGALQYREARQERMGLGPAKIEHRQQLHALAVARGARAALSSLQDAGVTATTGTFSARKMFATAAAHADEKQAVARAGLLRVQQQKREKLREQRRSAIYEGGGGGGGGSDEIAAAPAEISRTASSSGPGEAAEFRKALGKAEGAILALGTLRRAAGSPVELAECLRAQCEVAAEAEKAALTALAAVKDQVARRKATKSQLRRLFNAAKVVESVAEGGGSGGGGGGGGALAVGEGGGAEAEEGLPGSCEAERAWEERHVALTLATAVARLQRQGAGATSAGWSQVHAALQMQSQPWLVAAAEGGGGREVVLGEAQMRAAAAALQLRTEGGESEWSLLWLARELLQASLPAGWTTVDALGGGALPTYRATHPGGGTQEEHPLLPALLSARDVMRRRLRLRYRAFCDLESVWLFAQPQKAQAVTLGAGVYIDLSQPGSKPTDTFPAKASPPRPVAAQAQAQAQAAQAAAGSGARAALQQKRQQEEEQTCAASRAERAAAAAAAEKSSRALRWDALRACPRCGVELMHAARALRINLRAQPELAFLAELALCLPLPAGWEPIPGTSSYRNTITKVTVASHPLQLCAAAFT